MTNDQLSLGNNLNLPQCPHCGIQNPLLRKTSDFQTVAARSNIHRTWFAFACSVCGGGVLAAAFKNSDKVIEYYPELRVVDAIVPERARKRLQEASNALHAPGASIMSCASGIDWMLKDKGYDQGVLFNRIEQAAAAGLLTDDMKEWAHVVRLEANAERHADPDYADPTTEDAKRTLDFALALAEILYVLPERANQGRQAAQQGNP